MKLKALGPINHDGKDYPPGKTLTVDNEDQAQALVDCGAAEEIKGESAAEKKNREKREAAVADAQKVLDDSKSTPEQKAEAQKVLDEAAE